MSALRLAAAALLALTGAACASQPAPPPDAAAAGPDTTAEAALRGRAFATQACAGCHAVGPAGASPLAAAPPFRVIVRRQPLDQLEARFAEGLAASHPAMPAFVFRASEIDDMIAWLETVKTAP